MKLKYGPYSPSRLEVANCPYSFFRQYIDPDKKALRVEGLPQARGSVVHEVLEQITKEMIKIAPNHIEAALPFSSDDVERLIVEAIGRHPAAYQDVPTIRGMIDLYLRRRPVFLTNNATVEVRMAVKWSNNKFIECDYDDPEAAARGRADIMMLSDDLSTALVYDHKTQPNVEEADTFQLGFYSWVILRSNPFLSNVKTILHFVRYGKYTEPFVWSKDDLQGIEDEIMTRISIIESKTSWDAVPNKMCQYCPVLASCPVMSENFEIREDGTLVPKNHLEYYDTSTEGAVKMAQRLQVLEEFVRRDKDRLKEHVKLYGPVAIHGKVYDFSPDEKVDWDKVNKIHRNHAYEVFRKHGKDEREFMGFSQTFSTGIWRLGSEELIKELEFPKKITSEFRGRKA